MTIERIQLRRGTAQQWTDTNPILGAAEIGVELGTPNKFKIGDGSSTWSELEYFTSGAILDFIPLSQKGTANGVATLDENGAIPTGQLANIIESAPSTLDTLNELAAALSDDANFATTVTNSIADKADIGHIHPISDVTNLQDTLDSKASLSHTHTKSDITDFEHTHTKSDITDFTHTHNASEITNTLSNITSTTYTLQASDNGKTLILNPTGGSISFTINNVFSVGQRADVYLKGTSLTFVQGTGTIESAGLSMATQYTVASIICIASGVYAIVGNLE